MSEKSATTYAVLHLRFKLRTARCLACPEPRSRYDHCLGRRSDLEDMGLQEEEFEMGGMYLFANRETAEAYLNHPVIQAVRSNPAVVSTQSELWDVESSPSALTRASVRDICVQYSELSPPRAQIVPRIPAAKPRSRTI